MANTTTQTPLVNNGQSDSIFGVAKEVTLSSATTLNPVGASVLALGAGGNPGVLSSSNQRILQNFANSYSLPLMVSPPTIGSSSTTTTLSGSYQIVAWNDPRMLVQGGVLGARVYGQAGENDSNQATNHQLQVCRCSTMFEGRRMSIVTGGTGGAGYFRVLINDQYVSASPIPASETDNVLHYHDVDFGSRIIAKITVEFCMTSFGGVYIEATANAWFPIPKSPRVLIMGDSISEGTGATTPLTAWPTQFANIMGWKDIWIDGQGSSGYLANGSGGGANFASRLAFDMVYSPDIIIIFGGINDRPVNNSAYTPASLQAAVQNDLLYIKNSYPTGYSTKQPPLVYVLGCWQPSGSPSADIVAANTAILSGIAMANSGAFAIDPTGWITGTGRVGSTTGIGNADFCMSSDGSVHPTDEGHNVIARRLADTIIPNIITL